MLVKPRWLRDDRIPAYGAYDEQGIQLMVDRLGSGGELQLERGTYMFGSQLILPSGFHLRGKGPGTVLKLMPGKNIGLIRNKNWGPTTLDSDITISNLAIDGAKANQGSEANDGAISLRGVDRARVYNCYVKDFWGFGGIYLAGSESQIYANYVSGCKKTNYGNGIYITGNGENRVIIANNICINNEGNNLFVEDFLAEAIVANNISIGGVRGIFINGGSDNSVKGNYVSGADSFGIELSKSGETALNRGIIEGNIVKSTTNYDGIIITTAGLIIIKGNISNSNGRYGINMNIVTDCIAEGNIAHSNANYNLIEQGASDYNIIHGNNLRTGTNKISTVGANSIVADNLT